MPSSFSNLIISLIAFISLLSPPLLAQSLTDGVPAIVDFSSPLRDWDGFGFQYTEVFQTSNFAEFAQDLGGFSVLSEKQQQEIAHLVFGEDGLKVALVSIPLDPFHQEKSNGKYDHARTTENMRSFVRQGLALTRSRGADLNLLTTLYAPPAYMTVQKAIKGRDLNHRYVEDLARYMVDWVMYLKEREGFPVGYLSLHAAGEAWQSWNGEGKARDETQPYSLYWPSDQLTSILRSLPAHLQQANLPDVQLTNGEPVSWNHLHQWGHAYAIANDAEALQHLGLITSQGKDRNQPDGQGIQLLKSGNNDLHAWATAVDWGEMDESLAQTVYRQIYQAGVNAVIPQMGILRLEHLLPKSSSVGAAILVDEDGTYQLTSGYHVYKQLSRAGQAGTSVVRTVVQDEELSLIGFGNNGTEHPDAFVLINTGMQSYTRGDAVEIRLGPAKYHFNLTDPEINFNYRRPQSLAQQRLTAADTRVQLAKRFTETGYILEVVLPKMGAGALGRSTAISRNLRCDLSIFDRSHLHEQALYWNTNKTLKLANQEGGDVQYVPAPPVVDGEIDALWQDATFHKLGFEGEAGVQAHLRLLSTQTNLYFLIEVDDPTPFPGREVAIEIKGSSYQRFEAFRSTNRGEKYEFVGIFEAKDGILRCQSPSHSVTTFFGVE